MSDFFEEDDFVGGSRVDDVDVQGLIQAYQDACAQLAIKPWNKLLVQLQSALVASKVPEVIDLRDVKVDAKGLEALNEVVGRLHCVDILNLENASLDDTTVAAVCDMVQYHPKCSFHKINLSKNPRIWARGWKSVGEMLTNTTSIRSLLISGTGGITGVDTGSFKVIAEAAIASHSLRELALEDTGLNGQTLVAVVEVLRQHKTLEILRLGDNRIRTADIKAIAPLLGNCTTLTTLDLRHNPLGDAGVSLLCEILSGEYAQQQQQQNSNPPSRSNSAEALPASQTPSISSNAASIMDLVLWGVEFRVDGARALASHIAMPGAVIRTLNIGRNDIGDAGIEALSAGLLRNKSLKKIGLVFTGIKSEGAISLAEAMAHNATLARIDLRENDVGLAGLLALSASMKMNRTVMRLDLSPDPRLTAVEASTEGSILSDIESYSQRNLLQRTALKRASDLGLHMPHTQRGEADRPWERPRMSTGVAKFKIDDDEEEEGARGSAASTSATGASRRSGSVGGNASAKSTPALASSPTVPAGAASQGIVADVRGSSVGGSSASSLGAKLSLSSTPVASAQQPAQTAPATTGPNKSSVNIKGLTTIVKDLADWEKELEDDMDDLGIGTGATGASAGGGDGLLAWNDDEDEDGEIDLL